MGVQLRMAALLVVGALLLHELRVLAGYGHEAELILREPGHAYLPFATALAVVLAAFAGIQFAWRLTSRRAAAAPSRSAASPVVAWLGWSAALAASYLVQAGVESFFDPGHPILAHGGWTVVPLALAIGAVVTFVTREADRALAEPAIRRMTWRVARVPVVAATSSVDVALPRRQPLADNRAGRAPPFCA